MKDKDWEEFKGKLQYLYLVPTDKLTEIRDLISRIIEVKTVLERNSPDELAKKIGINLKCAISGAISDFKFDMVLKEQEKEREQKRNAEH